MSREMTREFPRALPGFAGELILPGDERYDAARVVWNAAIDRRPALIARAHSAAGPRRDDHTTWTALAPEAVFTVRT